MAHVIILIQRSCRSASSRFRVRAGPSGVAVLRTGTNDEQAAAPRTATANGVALGDDSFISQLEQTVGRPARSSRRGPYLRRSKKPPPQPPDRQFPDCPALSSPLGLCLEWSYWTLAATLATFPATSAVTSEKPVNVSSPPAGTVRPRTRSLSTIKPSAS